MDLGCQVIIYIPLQQEKLLNKTKINQVSDLNIHISVIVFCQHFLEEDSIITICAAYVDFFKKFALFNIYCKKRNSL